MLTSKVGPLVGKALAVTGGAIAIHTNLQVLVEMVACIYFHRKFEGGSMTGLEYHNKLEYYDYIMKWTHP